MRKIPDELRMEILDDIYYKFSCLSGKSEQYRDRIVWHHCWEYRGVQINEKWAIMPLMESEHSPYSERKSVHNCKEIREFVKYLSLKRAKPADLKKYPKKNWQREMWYLRKYKNY